MAEGRKSRSCDCTNLGREIAVEGRAAPAGLKGDLDVAVTEGAAVAAAAFVEAVAEKPTAA